MSAGLTSGPKIGFDLSRVGAGLSRGPNKLRKFDYPLLTKVQRILRKYGTGAHVYLPGIGVINGLTAGNYLDSAGTTPATVDNPVGLDLDAMGVVGAELVTNGGPFTVTTGWSPSLLATLSVVSSSLRVTNNGAGSRYALQTAVTIGSTYLVTGVCSGDGVDGKPKVTCGGIDVFSGTTSASPQTYTARVNATATNITLVCNTNTTTGVYADFASISVKEISGIHASQATTANKPILRSSGGKYYWQFDSTDLLTATYPAGYTNGTMIMSSSTGTVAYGINIAAGSYNVVGIYRPGNNIYCVMVFNSVLTEAEKTTLCNFCALLGGSSNIGAAAFTGVTDFTSYWRSMKIKTLPIVNTSAATNVSIAWQDSSLTSFPLLDMALVTNAANAWQNTAIVSFPALNLSAVNGTTANTGFDTAWSGANLMTDFPASMFNICTTTRYLNAFNGCSALTQASIENIYVSIASGPVSNGVLDMPTQATAALMTAPAIAARATLVGRGWTVTPAG